MPCEECKKKDAALRDALKIVQAYAEDEGYDPTYGDGTFDRLTAFVKENPHVIDPEDKAFWEWEQQKK